MHIFHSTYGILFPDVKTFVQKARAAGVAVQLYEFPEAFHVFMGATFTPEAKDVYRRLQRILGTEEVKFETHGLTKFVSSPPVRVAVFLQERAEHRREAAANTAPERRGNTMKLLWGGALLALLLLRGASRRR